MKNVKRIILFIVLSLIITLPLEVLAVSTIKKITAQIDYSMKMKLNGKAFNPIDSKTGESLKPITYKNIIYVPVNAVAYALKIPSSYNSTNKTVSIGPSDTRTSLFDMKYLWKDTLTTDVDLLSMYGKLFNKGVYAKGYNSFTCNFGGLENRYKALTFKVVAIDSQWKTLTGTGYVKDENGILIKQFTINEEDDFTNVKVDVSGVKNVNILIEYSGTYTKCLLVDGWLN